MFKKLSPYLKPHSRDIWLSAFCSGMNRLMEGRTVFIIAHRLSTVRDCDMILVLEQGQILERGSHQELLRQKGRYYNLYTGAAELT